MTPEIMIMDSVSLQEAERTLDEPVRRAHGGEWVEITEDGTPVVLIGPPGAETPAEDAHSLKKEPIDFEALRELRSSMPMRAEPAGEFMREMRDEARY